MTQRLLTLTADDVELTGCPPGTRDDKIIGTAILALLGASKDPDKTARLRPMAIELARIALEKQGIQIVNVE